MSWRLLVSPVVVLALTTALLISLSFHFGEDGHLEVNSFFRSGPKTRPTLRIDFDASLADGQDFASLARLDPPAPVEVRLASPRRLLIRPRADLPAGAKYQVVLDDGLAAADGRPISPDLRLLFDTGDFGLTEPPVASIDDEGRSFCRLNFCGPVEADDLRRHLRLTTRDGNMMPYRLSGAGEEWTALLEGKVEGNATLRLLEGLPCARSATALERDVEHEITWDRTLRFVRARAYFGGGRGSLRLRFSTSLDGADPEGFVEVHPAPPDLKIGCDGRGIDIRGAFESGQEVSVRVRKGFCSPHGDRLARQVSERLRIPGASPRLRFLQSGRALSTRARAELEFGGVNVPLVKVELRRVYPNNLVRLALRESLPNLATRPITKTIRIGSPQNVEWSRRLDLADLAGETLRGVYEARIHSGDDRWTRDRSIIQASDLAPIVRVRDNSLVTMVMRLSDGKPAAGAKVTVFSRTNQVAAEGVTDGDGIFRASELAFEPFVVAATQGDELTFVDLRTHRTAHRASEIEGRSVAAGTEAYLYTNRGLVRPGERVRVEGLLRVPEGRAPKAGLPVRLVLFDPKHRELKSVRRKTSEFGWIEHDFSFPTEAPTGSYRVEARLPGVDRPIGQAKFRIEAFLPDRIEPFLSVPKATLETGAPVVLGISAHLLDGRPAAGHAARLEVRYTPSPEQEGGFHFGDPDRLPAPFTVPLSEMVLDEEGRGRVECHLPNTNAGGVALRALFRLEVLDEGGRAAYAAAERRVVPAEPRLGLAAPPGSRLTLPVTLLGRDAAEAEAVLERERWEGSWVREDGRSVWRSRRLLERVETVPVRLREGLGEARFSDPGDGHFRVSVRAPGCVHAVIHVTHHGSSYSVPSARGPAASRLVLQRVAQRVVPGLPAELTVEAPFAGRALLTLEGRGVFEAWPIEIESGRQSIFAEVPPCNTTNLHATLTLVRGMREAGEAPVRLLSAVALPLDLPERLLPITVQATNEVQPGEELEVTVKTGRPAEVTLHLVDIGILRRSAHPVPDPAAHFGAVRRLDTRLADTYTRLLDRMRFGGEDAEPGGGGYSKEYFDPNQARLIETVAIASQRVRVDGTAERVRLPIPDTYEGRLRLVAVGAGATGTGSVSQDVVVKAAISLRMFAPRVAAPGDQFTVPLVVRGEYTRRSLTLEGPIELVGEEREDALELRATEAIGVASLTLDLEDDQGNRTRRTASISVRPAAAYTIQHIVREVAAGERLDEPLPGNFLNLHRKATVRVGAMSGLELLPAMERLLEYPHGCVEQTTSRAFPILAWHELLRRMHPEGEGLSSRVEAAVDHLFTMQTSSGGLAMWSGGTEPYLFGSVYAADFLLEARDAGYSVPIQPLAGLLDSLEHSLQRGEAGAYAAQVLSRAGRPMRAWLNRLAETELRIGSRARLASAFLRLGDRDRAREVLGDAGDPWAVPREQGGELSSPVRAAALLLGALVATDPDDARIPELALRLRGAARRASERTTQESAAALLALAHYFRTATARNPDLQGVLELGSNEEAFSGAFGTALSIGSDDPWHLAFRANGPATLIVRVEGIPTGPEAGVVERGMSVRRWIEDLSGERAEGVLEQGRLYRIVVEGVVPPGSENLLVSDLLPGGLEVEDARGQPGNLKPDRIEPRDDRVLFFRTAPIEGTFRQSYLVRAVTVGRFALPATEAELMYEPAVRGRGEAGVIEVRAR